MESEFRIFMDPVTGLYNQVAIEDEENHPEEKTSLQTVEKVVQLPKTTKEPEVKVTKGRVR